MTGGGAPRFYLPTREPEDWAEGLADRAQWAAGRSAYELAHAWELAKGQLPPKVSACLGGAGEAALRNITPLVGFPEHRVDFHRASDQTTTTSLVDVVLTIAMRASCTSHID